MTSETPDRRRETRILVPRHLTGPGLERRSVRLLDLSAKGARIEHAEPLRGGLVCYVDLPSALGGGRLTGRVVWTRLYRGEQTFEGDALVHQSGLAFVDLTPEQREALAAALEILQRGE